MSLSQVFRVVVPPAGAAIVAAAAAWAVSRVLPSPWLSLLAGGAVGVLIYLALILPAVAKFLPPRLIPRWVPQRDRLIRTGMVVADDV